MNDEKILNEIKEEPPKVAKDKSGRAIKEGAETLLRFRVTKVDNKRPRGGKPIVHLETIEEHGPSRMKTGIWLHDDEIALTEE
jgi:hypothetical protein